MQLKVFFVFVIVAIAGVLGHPGLMKSRDDAQVPAQIQSEAAVSPDPIIPEEQPTSAAQQDDVTAEPVTLPAAQEGGLPEIEGGSNSDNLAVPQLPNVIAVSAI